VNEKALPLAICLLLAGCIGPEHYYGGYRVSCAEDAPAQVRDEVNRIATEVATKLNRPLNAITSGQRPGSLTLIIGSPPTPSIAFSYDELSPGNAFISVVAPDKEENDATRGVRGIIESALQSSKCARWNYSVRHTSLAGG